jgi:hypothetical protein
VPIENLSEQQAAEAIRWLADFLTPEWVQNVVAVWERRAAKRRFVYPFRPHENVIAHLFALQTVAGARGRPLLPWEFQMLEQLATIAVDVRHVATRVTPPTARRLASLLKKSKHVDGFLYQCCIAAHYVRDGYGLKSFSVGDGAADDVLVLAGDDQIEFQCKALGLGAGRRVPPITFADCAAHVLAWVSAAGWRGIIKVRFELRLDPEDVLPVARQIIADITACAEESCQPGFRVTYEPRTENLADSEVTSLLVADPSHPLRQPSIAILRNPSELGTRFVLQAISDRDDNVVVKMLREAAVAASQLRGTVPGVVAVHIPEAINWESVRATGRFDQHVRRATRISDFHKANAIAFTSGEHQRDAYVLPGPGVQTPLPREFRLFGMIPTLGWS